MPYNPQINQTDHELLTQVTDDPGRLTNEWYAQVNDAAIRGATLGTGDRRIRATAQQLEQQRAAREEFYSLLGITEATNPLHNPYNEARQRQRHKNHLVPGETWGMLRLIHAITGDAIGVSQRSPKLLAANSEAAAHSAEHIEKIIRLVGWTGTVNQLVIADPDVLLYSTAKINVAARLAVEHGIHTDTNLPAKRVAKLAKMSMERQILAITEQAYGTYVLGREINWYHRAALS